MNGNGKQIVTNEDDSYKNQGQGKLKTRLSGHTQGDKVTIYINLLG